jgi:phosphoglycerate kinase
MNDIRPLSTANVSGKRVLLRAGFDVPLENGVVSDTRRIEALVPTMRWILDHGGRLILLAHQGRPKGKPTPEFSQRPLVAPLETLLKTTVHFSSAVTGPETEKLAATLQDGEVLLVENLRFDPREEKDDPTFAKELAALGDLYVNDAFTNCHRAHSSVSALAKLLPGYAGLNLLEELTHLAPVTEDPRRPLTLVISGAKMETKVPVIRRFLSIADDVIVGGAIANTFLAARGFDVGTSLYEPEQIELVQEIMLESEKSDRAKIHLPNDVVVASAEVSDAPTALDLPVEEVEGDMSISDIGAVTAKRNADIIAKSGMVVWNGPLGLYEEGYDTSSKEILKAIAESGAFSVVGGGDTVNLVKELNLQDKISFVSTGGGAMLEFLAKGTLVGIESLNQ